MFSSCTSIIILHLLKLSTSIELSCMFKTRTNWWAIDHIYFCDQDRDVNISISNKEVTSMNGTHIIGMSNSDIKGFRVNKKQLELFPQNLNKFVGDLEFIAIWDTELKEIHQIGLKSFTSLRILSIWNNDIEVLEKDIFKFNINLEYIGLGRNKIKTVEGRIFNHLRKLHSLHFDDNPCISRQVADNIFDVWDLTEEIEENC